MLAISTPGLYLTPGGNAPPGTPADPVLGLVIDETAGYTVMAVMILEQPGRVVKVSGAGRSFTRQPLLLAFTTVPGSTSVNVIVWACPRHIHADVSYPHTLDFDATVRYQLAGMSFLVVVEAKLHKNPIKRELVQILSRRR